jgi:spermidine/putrescine transport system permease protein
MTLPLYVALEKIQPSVLEAAQDLYAGTWSRFRRVTLPLALPGVVAGSLLTFIPAVGDFVNAELLGNPQSQMIGNIIQARFLKIADYPMGAALSFILMAAILAAVLIYARLVGTEELYGSRG